MQNLYNFINTAFCVIVVLSNMMSAKMVALPYLGFSVPAGLVIYPLTFLLSDFVTEIFGSKKAKKMVYTALCMSLLSFGLIKIALILPSGINEDSTAFETVLGLTSLRIFSSLTAYIIAQVVDIQLYILIKQWTGSRFLWLRNNGATCLSQMIDTIVIDILFLYWGLGMEMKEVFPIMLFSFLYKALFSLSCTPLFYLWVFLSRKNWKKTQMFFKQSDDSLHNDPQHLNSAI